MAAGGEEEEQLEEAPGQKEAAEGAATVPKCKQRRPAFGGL